MDREDEAFYRRDAFFTASILEGIDSVPKLMALTYLSQFEVLKNEFAQRPVYQPDFTVVGVPYSSALLNDLNNFTSRMGTVIWDGGAKMTVQKQENTDANTESMIDGGAQLSRLYKANLKNYKRFAAEERKLYQKVRSCLFRDRKLREMFAYLDDLVIE